MLKYDQLLRNSSIEGAVKEMEMHLLGWGIATEKQNSRRCSAARTPRTTIAVIRVTICLLRFNHLPQLLLSSSLLPVDLS